MANRRKPRMPEIVIEKAARRRPAGKSGGVEPGVRHEVVAVALACAGVLTLLALVSYHPADASLNASGPLAVKNWIGPAGAYWSDFLLQVLGIGAYALGVGSLLASWRSLTGRRVTPGLREAAGTALLVISVGAFAHLVVHGEVRPYPAGGVAGAILGNLLREQFAVVGAYVLSGALVLVSLALTADGILAGLGLRGVVVLGELASRAQALWVAYRAKRARVEELRAVEPPPAPAQWGWIESPEGLEKRKERRKKRVADAKEQALAEAEALAAKEREEARAEKERAAERAEPAAILETTVDLASEEAFAMGELPRFEDPREGKKRPAPVVLVPEPSAEPKVVAIRAAVAAPFEPPPPIGVDAPLAGELVEARAETGASPAPIVDRPKSAVRSRKKAAEPEIVDVRPEVTAEEIERKAAEGVEPQAEAVTVKKAFELPPVTLLDYEETVRAPIDPEKLRENAQRLVKTLKEYGIDGQVREIRPGPVVTMYEYVPAPGIKISKIASLADDLAMSMAALRVRIVAPIPGKGAVGIEIPNESRETVYLKEIVAHDTFRKSKPRLTMALGKDIEGNAYVANLAKMPHLLVAGATGTGKSVSVNAMIMSILCKATPDEVRLIMVDPKMLELSVYDGIPHLLLPVVTDPKKAALALRWAVEEMERRYQLLSELGVRNIDGYNEKIDKATEEGRKLTVAPKKEGDEEVVCERLPYIVVIVDELADLMMVASREVEASIMRLAQMARAAGIHLILATQRPSVDVLTGVIKANFPSRIAFQVASKHDSRTIIDANGAEHLLGKGDMLYLSPGVGGIMRIHGAFVSDAEVERTVAFIKAQGAPQYDESILAARPEEGEGGEAAEDAQDEMYDQAVAIVSETRQASISMIQRRLRIGYNRAARLVEQMETQGIVGPADGAKPREVLVQQI